MANCKHLGHQGSTNTAGGCSAQQVPLGGARPTGTPHLGATGGLSWPGGALGGETRHQGPNGGKEPRHPVPSLASGCGWL